MATDLAVGARLGREIVLEGVAWATYADLRDNPANDGVRMTYLDGTLCLMSPEYIHEEGAELLGLLIRAVTRALGLEVKGIGSTTLRRAREGRPLKGSGKEPDTAFYLGANERRMRKRKALDLSVDPPPDLAIEVDNKADSSLALPIYARLGVPEVWRYEASEHTIRFGRLIGDDYEDIGRSLCLPMLTPDLVLAAIDHYQESDLGENAWSLWLEDWARGLAPPPHA